MSRADRREDIFLDDVDRRIGMTFQRPSLKPVKRRGEKFMPIA